MGSCLVGTEFQFQKMRKFCEWMGVMVTYNVSVLNATELVKNS